METVTFLIAFPLVPAVLLFLLPQQSLRALITRTGALAIAAGSVYLAFLYLGKGTEFFAVHSPLAEKGALGMEILITLYLLWRCTRIKAGEWWIPALILLQAGVVLYCELGGKMPEVEHALYVDNFSIIMALIIGIIGSLICVYAISYMKEYHEHHKEIKDRRRFFFFILFFFLSAMFGVVFANNITWLYLFWEITTLCSFELIGYSQDEVATRNSYRALGLNALGGLGFALGILYCVKFCAEPTLELSRLIDMGPGLALIPAVLLSFAGLTKSAQMPFSSWLLGAMVAPTPVSALLHSSTMVKAGVFIIIKFAPVLQDSWAGWFLACVGGLTFLLTSILAVTQSNAKRVLAYSTIANLGLIVMCAGVGNYGAVWAAIMLVIFHAVAKGLLFLGVGTIEHKSGSRDIEDMDGLIVTRPWLGAAMIVGMLGMFLAPFGMLISKWACIEALVLPGPFPPVLVILLAFGSAPTLFFWAKWMGKVLSVPVKEMPLRGRIAGDEIFVLGLLAALTVAASGFFPLMATEAVDPYVGAIYGTVTELGQGNTLIMLIMLGLMVVLPLAFAWYPKKAIAVRPYLAGANVDGGAFLGALGIRREVTTRNYYLTTMLDEKKITVWSVWVTIAAIAAMFLTVRI